jgi:hypothetical protein
MDEIESGLGGGGRTDLLVGAGEALANDLTLEGAALVEGEVLVVLREPRLPLLVHEQHEPDRHVALSFPCCVILEVSSTCGLWGSSPLRLFLAQTGEKTGDQCLFSSSKTNFKMSGFFLSNNRQGKKAICSFKLS